MEMKMSMMKNDDGTTIITAKYGYSKRDYLRANLAHKIQKAIRRQNTQMFMKIVAINYYQAVPFKQKT
jgi:hypothetical protein